MVPASLLLSTEPVKAGVGGDLGLESCIVCTHRLLKNSFWDYLIGF